MRKILFAVVLAALAAAPGFAQTPNTWRIDANHSAQQFSVRHMGISKVQGQFTKVTGTVELDEKDITKSSVNATIDVSSVDTRVESRDNDLRSPNFFDVAKYPTMTFQSKKITQSGGGKLQVVGDLTLHGVTREVTLEVDGPSSAIKDPGGNLRRGFEATTKINRQDFGLTYNKALGTGELVVGDEISITLDIEIVKKP
jgi:polyisoprenoid-binding protein YceI